ncbi:unnamed protein product [Arabis nemorensis]|uniref:Uncharacterized protein n=1 Tax=Arabis nemorensis TaxID=586526 RepID=A0A565AUE5_9BRAS|nr:unnamed protein product [Arabis nemorensis]
MLHLRRCSAVQIHPSSRNSAPPIRRHEALQKTGGSSPPSARDVVVVVCNTPDPD